ncbi:DUF3006 domain-containing protein [Desulfuribacillus alkaliarsenatis]|uniref:DUF3006 domain-containing protein n=1 Tax=Desulfuribacillus alkaliarsenatis TaxID=766136 RepID=A0A1E5G4T0_9FIRM|nr:DUF3006 domain-containing protein [Desulfuribacillus alkaliarsenatis]OEF97681.1 hypothetical protein BHF68_14360 [Desulfuribacillus alkaliarsenatis]
MNAVIDRILKLEGKAVLIIDINHKELVVPIELLPTAAQEGDYVSITKDHELSIIIEIDTHKTSDAKTRIENKLTKLRQNAESRFKKPNY